MSQSLETKKMTPKFGISDLPKTRGTYHENFPLAPLTTLKIGGPADVFFEPADLDDLQLFMAQKNDAIPATVLGEGSNAFILDGGIRGVVLSLKNLNDVSVRLLDDGGEISSGSGATNGKVSRLARENGLARAEFLCGIPGGIGGALKMNAGA